VIIEEVVELVEETASTVLWGHHRHHLRLKKGQTQRETLDFSLTNTYYFYQPEWGRKELC
jgi:hypothetical protein